MDSLAAIDCFWRAANYVSAGLLYLRANSMLRRPLAVDDVKPRAVGHWGCVPALNFIWANLLAAVRDTGADVRLFFGTGHAGPAWLSCSYLEGSLERYSPIEADEDGLASLMAAFGRSGGFTTELSVQYPGVLWSAGELGYTLAIAHGHSLSSAGAWTVAVLGDGELETAPTAAAFQALRKFAGRRSRLVVVVNCNGYRMGGPSELASWTDDEVHRYFSALGLRPQFIDGFDAAALHAALQSCLSNPNGLPAPGLVLLRTPKGALMPGSPGGPPIEGTARSHKPPLTRIRTMTELAWLEGWLRSFDVDEVFGTGTLDRRPFAAILPNSELLPGTARDRITWQPHGKPPAPTPTLPRSLTAAFVQSVRSSTERLLITSPDELASNRLEDLSGSELEVLEYLSEHQCLAWSIGAASAGRGTWFTSYDAFAAIVGSMVTQHLKFLDAAAESAIPLHARPVNVFLTSLGWRNSYSHQDPGLGSSILEKRFESFRCFLPASPEAMAAAVARCAGGPNVVNCVIADKYDVTDEFPATRLDRGVPFVDVSASDSEAVGGTPHARVSVIAAGDYVVREATRAARAVQLVSDHVSARVIALEELSWLYRESSESRTWRADLSTRLSGTAACILVTSLYSGVLSSLLAPLLPAGQRLTAFGFRSSIASTTAVGALLDSGCSWIQIAASVLELAAEASARQATDSILLAAAELRHLEQVTREELTGRYDDPEWYRAPDFARIVSAKGGAR